MAPHQKLASYHGPSVAIRHPGPLCFVNCYPHRAEKKGAGGELPIRPTSPRNPSHTMHASCAPLVLSVTATAHACLPSVASLLACIIQVVFEKGRTAFGSSGSELGAGLLAASRCERGPPTFNACDPQHSTREENERQSKAKPSTHRPAVLAAGDDAPGGTRRATS